MPNHCTARNANAAEKTVDQIVTDIKKGTVDQAIVNAALSKGLIIKAPGTKRSAEAEAARGKATGSQTPGAQAANSQPTEGNSNHISGPKGEPHSTDSIAQHILTDGYIPPKIKAALIASKFYLAPGQKASNPTTSPKGRKGASKGVTQGSNAAAGGSPQGRQQATSAKDPRDLEDSLYIRDIPSIYAREAEAEAEAEAYAYAEAEAHFTMEDMRNLVHATESNPIAEKAVYNALTMDPNVERVSEGLVRDWVKVGNNEKRDVYDEYYY